MYVIIQFENNSSSNTYTLFNLSLYYDYYYAILQYAMANALNRAYGYTMCSTEICIRPIVYLLNISCILKSIKCLTSWTISTLDKIISSLIINCNFIFNFSI